MHPSEERSRGIDHGPPRRIVHADLDTFFVSVERLVDPSLSGKPVIVGGKPDARGVVAACSYETRTFGVHSGMPLRTAARLCPRAVFLPGRFHLYRGKSREVAALLRASVPVVEQASIDEFYFDLTGCEELFGDLEDWCSELAQAVTRQTGLPITLGLASNRLMAKMATNRAKKEPPGPDRNYRIGHIRPGEEAVILAPLPVRALPGIGPRTAHRLEELGFTTLGDLQHASLDRLEHFFGEHGRSMHRRALGRDSTPVVPHRKAKSIGHETTFREDVSSKETVLKTLRRLAERTASDLRSKGRSATRVVLKWRYDDFETVTRSQTVRPTDEALDLYRAILPAVDRLFVRGRSVRLVGVRAEGLSESGYQTSLYEPPPDERRSLLRTIDDLRSRYGDDIIQPGSLK